MIILFLVAILIAAIAIGYWRKSDTPNLPPRPKPDDPAEFPEFNNN